MISSPAFPPLHTVRAGFPAYRVPSNAAVIWVVSHHNVIIRLVAIPLPPLQKLHRFDHCFLAPVHLLILLRQIIFMNCIHFIKTRYLSLFQQLYLYIYPLRSLLWAFRQGYACNIPWTFITRLLTHPPPEPFSDLYVSIQLYSRPFRPQVRPPYGILTIGVL